MPLCLRTCRLVFFVWVLPQAMGVRMVFLEGGLIIPAPHLSLNHLTYQQAPVCQALEGTGSGLDLAVSDGLVRARKTPRDLSRSEDDQHLFLLHQAKLEGLFVPGDQVTRMAWGRRTDQQHATGSDT